MIRRLVTSREAILFALLAALFLGFAVFVDGFANVSSLLQRSRYWVATGMIAVPMTFIIATAGIDLSVGSMVALCGVVLGLLYRDAGWPIAAAVVGAVLTGLAAGAFNGGVSSYLRVPPLVVTLATMALFRGLAMGLSKARSLGGLPDGFLWLRNGNAWVLVGGDPGFYVPVSVFALAAVFAVGWVVMRRTWVGRFAECIGENPVAAAFAAINVRRLTFALYAACGLVCGIAALFHTALYYAAKADTARGMELEAIACVVVGGTRISGGSGTIAGTLLGLLIIGILRYGLEMAGVKSQHVVIVVGFLLIATAVFNEWMATRKGE